MTDQPEHNGGRAAHALAVARGLVAALRAAGEDLDDPRPRGAPDAVVASPRGPIGIDVADAFHDGGPDPAGVAEGSSDSTLTEHLNATLQHHCRKAYGIPTYFVMDVRRTPLTDAADAPAIAAALTIPAGCRFARVFLRMIPRAGADPALFEVPRPRTERPA